MKIALLLISCLGLVGCKFQEKLESPFVWLHSTYYGHKENVNKQNKLCDEKENGVIKLARAISPSSPQ